MVKVGITAMKEDDFVDYMTKTCDGTFEGIKFVLVYGNCKPVCSYTGEIPKIMRFDTIKEAEAFRQTLTKPELYEIMDEVKMIARRHKKTLDMLKEEGD